MCFNLFSGCSVLHGVNPNKKNMQQVVNSPEYWMRQQLSKAISRLILWCIPFQRDKQLLIPNYKHIFCHSNCEDYGNILKISFWTKTLVFHENSQLGFPLMDQQLTRYAYHATPHGLGERGFNLKHDEGRGKSNNSSYRGSSQILGGGSSLFPSKVGCFI